MASFVKRRFPLFITNVTNDGLLIRVSGQRCKKTAMLINKLMTQRTKYLLSQPPVKWDEVYLGMLCAGFYQNKLRRAIIINVSNMDFEEVDIKFIDLGKICRIKLAYLRHFDIYGDPRLTQLEPLAKDYYLSRIINPAGKWDYHELYRVNKRLIGVFSAVIEMETQFLPIVSLYSHSCDVSAALVYMNFGMGVPLALQLDNIHFWVNFNKEFTATPSMFNCMSHSEIDILDRAQTCIYSEAFGVPRIKALELYSEHKVVVCHVIEGPDHFLVQFIDKEADFIGMVNEINQINHQVILQPPQIGSLCLARMSECGDIICRAVILNISATECELYALDYGHTQTVSYEDMFTISERFAQYGVFAQRFTLKEAAMFKGIGVNKLFQDLVNNKILNLRVVPTEYPSIQCAKLYTQEGEDIAILLRIAVENRRFTNINLKLQYQHLVVISHIKSCTNFYLCLMSVELEEIFKAMEMHCGNNPIPSRVVVNMACCAKSCDGRWYRSIVRSIEDNVVDVQFVDFGHNEKVEISNIRCISTETMNYHIQAIHCSLEGHQCKHDLETCTEHFKNLVSKKTLIATLIRRDNSTIVTEMLLSDCDQQGQLSCDINATLISLFESTKHIPDDDFDDTFSTASSYEYVEDVLSISDHSEYGYLSEATNRAASPDANIDTNSGGRLHSPVPLSTPYNEPDLSKSSQKEFAVTWVVNPKDFYIQILSLVPEYMEMMEKVSDLYKDVKSIDTWIPVDSSVLVKYSPDQMYRATVESNWNGEEYGVRYVDYGNKMMVNKEYLWHLDKQLMELPKMAVRCSLSGIQPAGLNWKLCPELDACFAASSYKCVFKKEGRIHKVSLYHGDVSVADKLIEKGLASATFQDSEDESQYDYYYSGCRN